MSRDIDVCAGVTSLKKTNHKKTQPDYFTFGCALDVLRYVCVRLVGFCNGVDIWSKCMDRSRRSVAVSGSPSFLPSGCFRAMKNAEKRLTPAKRAFNRFV